MRKVHIDGQEWKYKVGHSYVNIWDVVSGKRYNVRHRELGIPYSDDPVPVPPSLVKQYIEQSILMKKAK
jgi:hypothetical protein